MTHRTEFTTRPATWSGRIDGDGPEQLRWHQHVSSPAGVTGGQPDEDSVALLGFACDEGVRRNQGRLGAAEGPAALRAALGSLALHQATPIIDLGDVSVVVGDDDHPGDLEAGQETLGRVMAAGLDYYGLLVVLGGGHETAWGSYLGRSASARLAGQRVGVVNLDAHFDLREEAVATSGTPFRQMAAADADAGREFRYFVAGIARSANTRALFRTAEELGVDWVIDVDCQPRHLEALLQRIDAFCAGVDVVHLSVDLDVLPAAVAPGVSAPAGHGVPMEVIEAVVVQLAASGRLVLMDVVELCPRLDIDQRTARAAARLIHSAVASWRPRRAPQTTADEGVTT